MTHSETLVSGKLSKLAGVGSGTGLIAVGQLLDGRWGIVITYLSPALGYLVGYLLARWDAWADRRQRQRALAEFEAAVARAVESPELTDEQRRKLLARAAEIKIAVAQAAMDRVSLVIRSPVPAVPALSGLTEALAEANSSPRRATRHRSVQKAPRASASVSNQD